MISIKIRQGKSGKDTGCYHNGTGQFQVVIGNHVKDAYQYVMELVTIDENAAVTGGKKPNLFNRLVDVISSIFAPFLYTLAACGILQGILGIFAACVADTSY